MHDVVELFFLEVIEVGSLECLGGGLCRPFECTRNDPIESFRGEARSEKTNCIYPALLKRTVTYGVRLLISAARRFASD